MIYRIFNCTVLVGLSCAVLAAQGLPLATPESVGLSEVRLDRIDRVMQEYVDQQKFPGMTVSVARQGRLVWQRSYGHADIEAGRAVTTDDIFAIFSMSKPVTAVAALILWEEGRFRLEDPVALYLPAFAGGKVHGEEGPPKSVMTVRDLFTHTAGLGYGWGPGPVDKIYQQLNLWDPSTNLEQVVDKLAGAPLYFEPGTQWQYSTSIDVLGRLVEVLSGQPLATFFEERIFRPLGMFDTGFHVPESKAHRMTALYRYDPEQKKLTASPREEVRRRYSAQGNRIFSGGGGLTSTTADYLRFAQMLVNGGDLDGVRILGRKTVEMMHLDHLPAGVTMSWDKLAGHGHGLGVTVTKDVAASTGTGSPGDFGWDGAASTWFRVDPAEGLIVLLMTHRMPADEEIQIKLKTLVYQALVD